MQTANQHPSLSFHALVSRAPSKQRTYSPPPPQTWAAANGGVTNGGLRGVWPPFLEIGQNRPFSPFFCLFCPFPEGPKSTRKVQKTEEKGLFPQISSDFLRPPSLKPHLRHSNRHLGWENFGPEKKITPTPSLSLQTSSRHLCSPTPPPLRCLPLPLSFAKNRPRHHLLGRLLPRKNRNVCQGQNM